MREIWTTVPAWAFVIIALLLGPIAAWLVGYRYGPRLASRRGDRLIAFFADPDRG